MPAIRYVTEVTPRNHNFNELCTINQKKPIY
jgi:hypothetical protein